MPRPVKLRFFGSSLLSAYWNGAATYYRGILKSLASRGYDILFFEPNAYGRQENRDMEKPDWAGVHVYEATPAGLNEALSLAEDGDVLVKASGVGVFDEELDRRILEIRDRGQECIYWDVDAPATLDRVSSDPHDYFRELIPNYDRIFTYGGGEPVVSKYKSLGAKSCTPIYNALDPSTHFPVAPDSRFFGEIAFLGNRLPDREQQVDEYFVKVAEKLPAKKFLLGGSGWSDKPLPKNVNYLGHVYTRDHNALNSSVTAVLNLNRDSMARYGHSPATRVFEAAGAGACIISDAWEGIENFLEPNREVLVAKNPYELR
jgi:spore maturation protein CgeB